MSSVLFDDEEILVSSRFLSKLFSGMGATLLLVLSMLTLTGVSASADVPDPAVAASFTAPACAGETAFDPTENVGYAVMDLTQVFGERLASYNAGSIVPLYDAFGGSVLLMEDGTNTGETSYPPLCGTRYVEALDTSVSEWMFCTDRQAQTCGDTDSFGNLVDHDGNPINPMEGLTVNPKLSSDQEKLIAFLVQNGHAYAGVGNQAWDGVAQARSDLGSNERAALQTLIWCISDPANDASDFAMTCENNMGATEQARLLKMIPDTPELVLSIVSPALTLDVGETAEFTLTTNVFNQAIQVVTAGTATVDWAVCSGDATLTSTSLSVAGDDPSISKVVVICATATAAGSATVSTSATPPSTEHIGWSQSVNAGLAQPCQVYATFHDINKATVSASAAVAFNTAAESKPKSAPEAEKLADTGGSSGDLSLLWLGAAFFGIGSVVVMTGAARARRWF